MRSRATPRLWFDAARPETLGEALEELFGRRAAASSWGRGPGDRRRSRYRWDDVTVAYERLLAPEGPLRPGRPESRQLLA